MAISTTSHAISTSALPIRSSHRERSRPRAGEAFPRSPTSARRQSRECVGGYIQDLTLGIDPIVWSHWHKRQRTTGGRHDATGRDHSLRPRLRRLRNGRRPGGRRAHKRRRPQGMARGRRAASASIRHLRDRNAESVAYDTFGA